MREDYAKEEYSIRLMIGRVYRRFCSLSVRDKLWIAYFCMSFTMLVGRVENEHFWMLIALAINLLVAYEQVRKNSIIEKIIKEEETMDKDSLKGIFEGATLSDVQIVIAQSGSKVVYKEVTSNKEDKPQVTDEQVANAIRAINGKGKPLGGYQSWLGACCILSWKYGYPRNLKDCCERASSLPLEGVEYICKYENVRKFATCSFVKEDARLWSGYKPLESERTLFNECLSVAQALDMEIQKQIEAE